jgi:lambda family phage portal protein
MVMEANPGTLEQLPKGWEFASWDPQHPTQAFPAFVKNCLRKIASGLGCSYNALASDLEGVNYSSMRSGLLIERETWRRLQTWWAGSFLGPVYRQWINTASLAGVINGGGRPLEKLQAVRWTARGWAWVDPLKDTQAVVLGMRNGLVSPQDAVGEEGKSIEEVIENLAEFYALAKESGVNVIGPDKPTAIMPGADTQSPEADAASGTTDGTSQGRTAMLEAIRNGGVRNGNH